MTLVARASVGGGEGNARAAFDEIVRRFQDMVVGYGAALLGGDLEGAQDVAQEVFLEAYRTLPNLRAPAAFPGWLRLLVKKHCDRRTRRPADRMPLLSLESAWNVAAPIDIVETVLRRDTQAGVHAALRALPEGERTAVLLFYLGDHSLREIASFLDVPVTVVKNRLWRARKRLKERMIDQMAETLQQERPSNDDRFRERVFVRLHGEFIAQYLRDPLTADRVLLRQSREEFENYLTAGGPLTAQIIQFGSRLYTNLSDYAPLVDLMERYRRSAPSLTRAEEAWCRWETIRSLAAVHRCEEVVREQRAFVAWAWENLPGDPPIRLSAPNHSSFHPLRDDEEDPNALPTESLFPWVANIAEVGQCFKKQGLATEWAETVRALVAAAPKLPISRLNRFWALRNIVVLFYGSRATLDEAIRATEAIRALADEEDWEAPRWPIEATNMQMIAYADAGDDATARARAEEATRLLEDYEPHIDASDPKQRDMYHILCDNVASPLADRGYTDLALRLFPKVMANGQGSGWAHVRYAACLWEATGQREPVLELLRQGAPRDLGDSLLSFFRSRSAFASVKDDPEFIAALTVA